MRETAVISIINKANPVRKSRIFPKYFSALDQSPAKSLVAIALSPKSTITKNNAGKVCIRLNSP